MPKTPARIPHAGDDAKQLPAQTSISASSTTSITSPSTKHNAFDILMAPKKTIAPVRRTVQYPRQNTWGREGLGDYISRPETYSPDAIVRQTDKFVVVNDLYPKGVIHVLIMPRDPKISTLIPQDALEDLVFLEECKEELKIVRKMVGEELRRRYGGFSKAEQPRIAAMASEDAVKEEDLPPGRNWEKDIIEGIHSRPSMKHLHIHVVSGDMVGGYMRNRDAYNKFRTNELISLQDFPLARDDNRTPQGAPAVHRHKNDWQKLDMICWRCGANFHNRFADLRRHLAIEFEEWKRA